MFHKSLIAALALMVMAPAIVSGQARTGDFAGARKSVKPASTLNPGVIKNRIELYVLKNYLERHDEVILEYAKLPAPIEVDPLDWDIKVESRKGVIRKGTNLVTVTVSSKDNVYKQFIADVKLRTFDDIVVTSKRVDKKAQLTADDLTLKRIESTTFKRDYFVSIAELLDLQTTRMIPEGKAVFTESVELPDLIRRGDLIKILIRVKNLEVAATGKALEDGRLGDEIKAENLATGKKLTGQIHDKKTIVVEL